MVKLRINFSHAQELFFACGTLNEKLKIAIKIKTSNFPDSNSKVPPP